MRRIWNLRTKIVVLVGGLLLGAFALQSVLQHYSKERLFDEVLEVAEALSSEVTDKVVESIAPADPSVTSTAPARPPAPAPVARDLRKGRREGRTPEEVSRTRGTRVIIRSSTGRPSQFPGTRFSTDNNQAVFLVLHMKPLHEAVRAKMSQALRRAQRNMDEKVFTPEMEEELFRDHVEEFHSIPDSSRPLKQIPNPDSEELVRALMSEVELTGEQVAEAATIDLEPYTQRLASHFERSRRFDLYGTVAIGLLGILLAWVVGMRLTRPVRALADGFERVAGGDLEHRVTIDSSGEFAFLGDQFNRMAQGLQENRALERELVQRERIQHMGDLAAGVAHDVRNPLNAIHLNLGQIRDEFMPDGNDQQERFLRFTSDVQREVERLNELVTNFLSLAQPSSTDFELVAPGEILAELERLLGKEAVGRHVALRLDLDETLPALRWNRQEMKSAFLNVAMNALQSMEPDGGSLDLITTRRESGEIAVTFVDTGCGIPEENLEQIFIPYFTTREGGTGLGLAVARRIAERSGGRLQVRSRQGEGTAVSFVFPDPSSSRIEEIGEGGTIA